jgi:hypothetical protein
MRERLVTLACALAALALFYALFAPKPELRDTQMSRPTSAESRANGYLAAHRWLESTGVRVVSLRERYGALNGKPPAADTHAEARFAPKGNLLITTLPQRFDGRYGERRQLLDWVEAGNTLLVMAALGDTPEWSMSPPPSITLTRALTGFTGVEVSPVLHEPRKDDEDDEASKLDGERLRDMVNARRRLDPPERTELLPNRDHPLFAGVRQLMAESEYPADDWYARVPEGKFVLTLARERGSQAEAFWIRRAGEGSILVSAYASLFTNQMLGEQDNARLLANIVAQTVGPGGAVIFDDMHQGLSTLYHPETFFGDKRLRYTILLLLALWFVWVLGGTRLRAARPPQPAPGEGTLLRATGGFLARVLRPVDAGRRIFELFFNDLRRHLGEPQNGEPLWGWLERRPQLSSADLAALRSMHVRLAAGRSVDLKNLHSHILRVQEQIL